MAGEIILHLGAGPWMCHSIHRLRAAGYIVHTLDGNPASPGFALSDAFAPIDFSDVDAVVDYARAVNADLILPINEPGVWSAAQASQRLSLPGIPTEIAWRCLHKGRMRLAWAEAGLQQPAFHIVNRPGFIADAADALGYPVVLKPTFGWGSRGVSVLRSPRDLSWARGFAHQHARQPDYVVESFVEGTELTIEGLVRDGDAQVLAVSDKRHQIHPRYCVAMELNYPADLEPGVLDEVEATVKKAVTALGLTHGPFHAECLLNDEGVWLVELGARGGGSHIFGQIVEAVSGVCMPVALVKLLLGQNVDIRPRFRRGACYRFFAPPPGVFQAISGLDAARRQPGILDLDFAMQPGTLVESIAGDADRPGFVVARDATREEARTNADRALACISFVVRSPSPAIEESPAARPHASQPTET